ncbi:hypothetical protein MMC09_001419 [Bachmanniomyces sp. S44760]|nr:hypothetical protein [Bachmanniomyces sp. S44760]
MATVTVVAAEGKAVNEAVSGQFHLSTVDAGMIDNPTLLLVDVMILVLKEIGEIVLLSGALGSI